MLACEGYSPNTFGDATCDHAAFWLDFKIAKNYHPESTLKRTLHTQWFFRLTSCNAIEDVQDICFALWVARPIPTPRVDSEGLQVHAVFPKICHQVWRNGTWQQVGQFFIPNFSIESCSISRKLYKEQYIPVFHNRGFVTTSAHVIFVVSRSADI